MENENSLILSLDLTPTADFIGGDRFPRLLLVMRNDLAAREEASMCVWQCGQEAQKVSTLSVSKTYEFRFSRKNEV